MTYLLFAIIGLLGGLVSGMFGVGGGVVFVPLLILLHKVNPHVAIGTSLAIVVPTALIGAFKHYRGGMIDWKLIPAILIFALIGAWIGAHFSLTMETALLKRCFAVFLVIMAIKIFFTK